GSGYFRLDVGGQTYLFSLQGAARAQAHPGTFGLSYVNALTSTDLSYTLATTGVKEILTLKSAVAPTSYRFIVTPPAGVKVEARRLPDGSWGFFVPKLGSPVFILLAPTASDS